VEEIAAAARGLGIDAVFLTDHYERKNYERKDIARSPRGLHDGVLFVPGVEVRGNGGSILAVGLERDFDGGAPPAQRLAEFARQGAVSILGHVERIENWDLEPVHGFEIYNLHAEFTQASKLAVLRRLLVLPVDDFFERAIRNPVSNLAAWDRELLRGRRLAPVAGHDAHANVNILGSTVGTYPEMLRLFSTHVLAPELSAPALLDALRRGRTFVVFEHLGDGNGFALSYGEPGAPLEERATFGDTMPWVAEHTLVVVVPPLAAGAAAEEDPATAVEVRILHDGSPLPEHHGGKLPGPGVYRVELYLGGRLWIVAGPIWLS
jgi:hypothetical protein